MSWLGKVVGGTIGFAIGGPVGAVAGAALAICLTMKMQGRLLLEKTAIDCQMVKPLK